MKEKSSTRLRRLLAQKKTLVKPGAHNALAARIIEQAGFTCCGVTGYGVSVSLLGRPDVGLTTMSEVVMVARYIAQAVDIPVIADADTGFGNAINVMRTVEEFIGAGVAAIHIEDQVAPKRCGHVAGKEVIPLAEMVGKIRAADRVRRELDPDFLLIARCDARGVAGGSVDDLVTRANAYLDAGADMIFPEALESADEFARFAKEIQAPLIANMTEFGKSPLFTVKQLSEFGYRGVLFPVTLLRVAMKSVDSALRQLADQGTQTGFIDDMQTRADLYELLGYADFDQRDRGYFGGRTDQQ